MNPPPTLGNLLYRLVAGARHALFNQGELAQLTYGAFDVIASNVRRDETNSIDISYPVGYRPDKTAIFSTRSYSKEELLGRYQFLALAQMPVNGIGQLVTIVEALLGDVLRSVVVRHPQKLGAKRTIPLETILEAQSLEEIHIKATDNLLNDLSYKSPREFAESLQSLLSVNLLECAAFHRYVELKATRDIHVHNRGYVNDTYSKKAGSHARASRASFLPVDIAYFLESYETCLQLTEWLERELDAHWHSSERDAASTAPSLPADTLLPTGPSESSPPEVTTSSMPALEAQEAAKIAKPGKRSNGKRARDI
jgi:hypothetical protein